jgi:uroporphyrinogen decarboxylase
MNGYERFMTAIQGGRPDRVPIWELIINRPVIKALYPELFSPAKVKQYEWGSCGGFLLQADFVDKEDLDGITIFEDYEVQKQIDAKTFVDEWGITWQTNDDGIPYAVEHPLKDESDMDRWAPPDPDAEHRLQSLRLAVERFKGRRAIVFLSHDAFEFSHYLRGLPELLMDYVVNPAFAHRVARVVCDYKKRVLQRAAELGADVLCTGDDYAHRTGTIMSPEHFNEFVLPYLQEAVDIAKSNALPFLKHTDGYLWEILDELVNAGIDCLDPLEPVAGMDVGRVRQVLGNRIALAGNVDCGQLLPFGTPQEVEDAVKETLAKGAVRGGFILASSNSIHPAVNPQNYQAMVEAGRTFGVYPLDEDMVVEYGTRDYMARYRSSCVAQRNSA